MIQKLKKKDREVVSYQVPGINKIIEGIVTHTPRAHETRHHGHGLA